MRVLLGLFGLARSEPKEQPSSGASPSVEPVPPGVSPDTMAMLERMKRKVAKAAAASSLPATGARQVDAEIDAALVRSGGAALLERFKAEPRGFVAK